MPFFSTSCVWPTLLRQAQILSDRPDSICIPAVIYSTCMLLGIQDIGESHTFWKKRITSQCLQGRKLSSQPLRLLGLIKRTPAWPTPIEWWQITQGLGSCRLSHGAAYRQGRPIHSRSTVSKALLRVWALNRCRQATLGARWGAFLLLAATPCTRKVIAKDGRLSYAGLCLPGIVIPFAQPDAL